MKMKFCKFSLYPKLYECLKLKVQRQYKFECSLNPSIVASIRAKWSSGEKFHPDVGSNIFKKFYSFKHQRNKGQQQQQEKNN